MKTTVIALPLWMKLWVPGYRAKWGNRCAALIDHLHRVVPTLDFGSDDDGPWIEAEGGAVRVHGFWTDDGKGQIFDILQPDLPPALRREYFRLVLDYVNRYLYPHMRPDLKPEGYEPEQLFCFHGQHKDAIADLEDPVARALLTEAFRPKRGEIIIDCGSFIGLGELRISPDVADGHIYAVEADRSCYERLCRNLGDNGVTNVTPMRRAIWNEEKELELETNYAQANTLVREVQKGRSTQTVRTITIDQIVEQHRLSKVDMLSLTLNGAEVEALEGAAATLDKLRPRIRLAGWYSRGGRKIWQITKEQLEAHGYVVFVGDRGNVMALPGEKVRAKA